MRVKNSRKKKTLVIAPAFIHGWELLLAMTEREIKARYKYAVLGFLWIFLNPVLQMIIIGSVFSFILKVPINDYFLFLFSGLLLWNYFSYTLTKVTPAIVFELSLIEKAKFSREVIVLSIILSNLFHTVVSFILFVVLLLVLGKLNIWRVILLSLPLIWLTLLLSGIGLLVSALNVKYRDVNFFIQAVVPLWFYASPVLYNIELIPHNLQILMSFNPLAGILELTHWMLLGKNFPSPALLAINFLITILLFILGVLVFRKEARFFDDWV